MSLAGMPASVVTMALPKMDEGSISTVKTFQEATLQTPQLPMLTKHLLHAGMYHRTVKLQKDEYLTGALIRIATAVTISGDVEVFTGLEWVRYTGYHVIPASAHRKQIFVAHSDTYVTMAFVTSAKTVEAAEEEFTEEAALLLSRYNENEVIITGE